VCYFQFIDEKDPGTGKPTGHKILIKRECGSCGCSDSSHFNQHSRNNRGWCRKCGDQI
jgi:hypothetical protein